MVFAETLGREISDYILNLLNKEVTVLDEEQNIVVSPDVAKIGQRATLPSHVDELSSCKSIDIEGKSSLLIPLKYQSKNVAYLVVNEDGAQMQNYSSLVKSFAELLIQQHYENNKPNFDSTDKFILNVLNNYNTGLEKQYFSEAKILGYDTDIKRLAIAVYLQGFWDNCLLDLDQPSFERDEVIKNWKRNIENAFNSFFTKNADLIIAYAGNDKFLIFKAVTSENEESTKKLLKKSYSSIFESLKNHRIKNITVGFGNAYQGVGGLLSSAREADLTLELGMRIWGTNRSYFFGDLGLLSILGDGDREKKLHFAKSLLSKLTNADLNKTLECFFKNNLNLTDTALEMGIHRNTVIYRLNQITKVLEADPRIFEQAMSIKIALLIKSLFN